MIYQIGICDDENSTCSELESIIMDYFKIAGLNVQLNVWNCAEDFMRDIPAKVDVDILFLDIEMPDYNGIYVGEYIRNDINNDTMHIIYVSSKTNYAMELFKIHPYEFLEKPFNKDRLYKILDDLMDMYMKNSDMFFFKKRGDQIGIRFNDICYFQSDRKHVQIIKSDGMDEYVGKLSDIINDLPAFFVPVGKSYIVNINHVSEFHIEYIVMSNGENINISKAYRETFSRNMAQFRIYGGK